MLMLLFYVGDDLYAIDSSQVIEIIPRVMLRRVPHTPDYLAGLLNYRGEIIPVIDLGHLLQGSPCHSCLSTRIIIVNYPSKSGKMVHLGLMAEKVTDTLNKPKIESQTNQLLYSGMTHLGEIIMDEQGMIQFVNLESLLPEKTSQGIFP